MVLSVLEGSGQSAAAGIGLSEGKVKTAERDVFTTQCFLIYTSVIFLLIPFKAGYIIKRVFRKCSQDLVLTSHYFRR